MLGSRQKSTIASAAMDLVYVRQPSSKKEAQYAERLSGISGRRFRVGHHTLAPSCRMDLR
eukprot:753915-Hanusia_phi.AAC.12